MSEIKTEVQRALDKRWTQYLTDHVKPKIFTVMYTKADGSIYREDFDQRNYQCDEQTIEMAAKGMLNERCIRSMPLVKITELNKDLNEFWKRDESK